MSDVETPVAEPEVQEEIKDQVEEIKEEKSDSVSYDTHRKLLDEKKKLQTKYEKMVSEKESAEKKKLEEQGKFKELYDQVIKENDELKGFRKAVEENLKAEIESELEGVDDTIKDVINEIPDLSKKLSHLKKLKGTKKVAKDSPVSERAGGDLQVGNINLADYRGPEGRAKLLKLQTSDPSLFQKILELKNK
jgi:chromosome segregation ATPase